jgi:hypothetical protein
MDPIANSAGHNPAAGLAQNKRTTRSEFANICIFLFRYGGWG